ncbi:MAG: hypothetical protein WC389_20695 [Lutibacter sp.]|jgi:hypothetical protein
MSESKRQIANKLGIGNICLGHKKLVDEPLNAEDWAEVHRATLAYQHQIKLIVLNARMRTQNET